MHDIYTHSYSSINCQSRIPWSASVAAAPPELESADLRPRAKSAREPCQRKRVPQVSARAVPWRLECAGRDSGWQAAKKEARQRAEGRWQSEKYPIEQWEPNIKIKEFRGEKLTGSKQMRVCMLVMRKKRMSIQYIDR